MEMEAIKLQAERILERNPRELAYVLIGELATKHDVLIVVDKTAGDITVMENPV